MVRIATFVFFDIETTGLPNQEWNQTKIIDASFIAVSRKDIKCTDLGSIPPLSKLTFAINPQRPISPAAVGLTGLSNNLLRHAPVFKQKFASLYSFLKDLPPPVCLVAHNGNCFDFKILLAECNDAKVKLPQDLLCADSLLAFRKLLKGSNVCYKSLKPVLQLSEEESDDELITDDDDENSGSVDDRWSDDEWWTGIFGKHFNSFTRENKEVRKKQKMEDKRGVAIKKVHNMKNSKGGFKLVELYKRLLNKETDQAHRAEVDCLMLLECVVTLKGHFIAWSDENCKLLTDIKPLHRC